MPSFDAPIRLEHGPSRLLAAWHSGCDFALVLGAGTLLMLTLGSSVHMLWPLTFACCGCLAVLWRARWRHVRCAAVKRFELQADGRLQVHRACGRALRADAVDLVRCGPFLSLRGRVDPAVDGWWPRRHTWYLAVDGLSREAWRRLCAWSRAGLPRGQGDPSDRRS